MTVEQDGALNVPLMSEDEARAVLATMYTVEDPRPREQLVELLMTTGTTAMQSACPEATEQRINLGAVDL